jgi:tyrosinase
MQRFSSDPLPIPNDPDASRWTSAELLVYGVDHSGPSYEVRVFLDAPEADAHTPLELQAGYAGCFTVFGHGGCYGDRDHCDPHDRTGDAYDLRLPHPILPQTKRVPVTEALRQVSGSAVRITLVAVEPADEHSAQGSDAFGATALRLLTYAPAG